MINIGAYKSGANPEIDYAISKINQVNEFLRQDVDARVTLEETIQMLGEMFEQQQS